MKKENNTINWLLLIMSIAVLMAVLSSCSVKRYSYEATNLQEGEIQKNHVKCTVVKTKPTAKGYKHTLVTEKSDTIYRFYNKPLEINKCYYIWKTREEKNL